MPTISPSTRTIVNPLIKDKVTFIQTAAETQGERTLLRVELAPGGGNDLHYHKTFEEAFTVISGNLGIQLNRDIIELNAGESAIAPRGVSHRFFNLSDTYPAVFEVELLPASAGFETCLQVAYGLAADGLTSNSSAPKNLYHLALLVQWGDTNLPGIFRLLEPVLRLLGKRAIRRGMDQELIQRYCRF